MLYFFIKQRLRDIRSIDEPPTKKFMLIALRYEYMLKINSAKQRNRSRSSLMKKLCIYLLFKLGKKTLSRVERTLFMKNRDLSLPCPFNLYGFHIEDNEDPNFPFRVYFFAGEKALGTRIAH